MNKQQQKTQSKAFKAACEAAFFSATTNEQDAFTSKFASFAKACREFADEYEKAQKGEE